MVIINSTAQAANLQGELEEANRQNEDEPAVSGQGLETALLMLAVFIWWITAQADAAMYMSKRNKYTF